eukprot:scaffold90735_cov72-Phaeocystis_antarctica.AAC.5
MWRRPSPRLRSRRPPPALAAAPSRRLRRARSWASQARSPERAHRPWHRSRPQQRASNGSQSR